MSEYVTGYDTIRNFKVLHHDWVILHVLADIRVCLVFIRSRQ